MSDVTQTQDTTGVAGNTADIPGGTQGSASVQDTTPTGGGGGGDNNQPATYIDTSGATGGENDHHGYEYGVVTQTVDTLSGGGSPIQHANPAYVAPTGDVPVDILDTTRTDSPVTGGGSETSGVIAGNLDTVNFAAPLQTTNFDNLPVAPAAPTAVALSGAAMITWVAVADPAGAAVRAYRIEAVLLDGDNVTGGDTETSAAGVVFAGRNATSVVFGDVVPGSRYAFRVAATNDNGNGPFSGWSNVIVPGNDLAVAPAEITDDNRVNPIYLPDGSTIGLVGPAQDVAAVTGDSGEIDVTWSAPAFGTPTGYRITAEGETPVEVDEETFEVTLTALDVATEYDVEVVAFNEDGDSTPVIDTATSGA